MKIILIVLAIFTIIMFKITLKRFQEINERINLMSDNVDYIFYIMKEEIKPKCTYGEWVVKKYVFPKKGEKDE